ncbi:PLD nuclease N-terminal domain-containing protein [uncultured Aeromicrobium sp.]|uniref:PLD nuclease N-terminal domain-containing protein n=1 Tax=uncultured Aeromicrobium sp. TaxID=337820 RepID=UPI0025F5F8D9|nr:PLD nuclease N-terminal domain-containing protein [uncultured Aeromicrobium sp.]
MGKALLIVVWVVLVVYALFDIIATPKERVRHLPKLAWIALILLVPYAGSLLWIFFGQVRQRPSGPRNTWRPGPRGPDDDPDYLRGL